MNYYHYSGSRRSELDARKLEQHGDFRVLRRLPKPSEMWLATSGRDEQETTIAVVDLETTGLDPTRHDPIELGIALMRLDGTGLLSDVTGPVTMLEQPSRPIPLEVETLTGIGDRMVAGQRFDEKSLQRLFLKADVIVSHHAAFDRGFLVRRFPWIDLPWACSVKELDWRRFGLEGKALGHLVASAGHFIADSHRAGEDCWALTCLLARQAPDGRTVVANLLDTARRPTFRLIAWEAPFSTRGVLKAAGYRWNAKQRVWWIEGDEEKVGHEDAFLRSLNSMIRPETVVIDWYRRHAE